MKDGMTACLISTLQVDKATQEKQSYIVKAQGEVRDPKVLRLSEGFAIALFDYHNLSWTQAQSAKLIGEALQANPAFLTLRKVEVRAMPYPMAFMQFSQFSPICHAGCSRHCSHHR